MRKLAVAVLVVFCFLSVGCAVQLQPPQQGEWDNFHSDKHKVSADAKPSAEKQPAEH